MREREREREGQKDEGNCVTRRLMTRVRREILPKMIKIKGDKMGKKKEMHIQF